MSKGEGVVRTYEEVSAMSFGRRGAGQLVAATAAATARLHLSAPAGVLLHRAA